MEKISQKIEEVRAALPKRERRLFPTGSGSIALRAEADAPPKIAMFIPYNRGAKIGPYFTEYIAPSAFRKTLRERSSDVVSLWNHDPLWVLGRESNDTLDFTDSEKGLEGVVTLDGEDPMHRHFARRVERRDVQGASFAFEVVREEWEENEDGDITRTLQEVKLYDWSPVTFPAYPDSESERRSKDDTDVLAVRTGADIPAFANLLAAAKGGTLAAERMSEVRSWIDRLSALVPAVVAPVEPETDYDAKLRLRELRMRGRVAA